MIQPFLMKKMTISRNVKIGIIVLMIGLIALMLFEKMTRKHELFPSKPSNTWLHIKCCHQNGDNKISMVQHS